ncbi:MAG: hypothetical protein PHI94_02000 [Eubacteriaceae bacterium]|nr:hypothetical protein [Eubacteriaceae bacterium]MDD4508438.1 hypothetical protein [Eubacteriaceae bacterium]
MKTLYQKIAVLLVAVMLLTTATPTLLFAAEQAAGSTALPQ